MHRTHRMLRPLQLSVRDEAIVGVVQRAEERVVAAARAPGSSCQTALKVDEIPLGNKVLGGFLASFSRSPPIW